MPNEDWEMNKRQINSRPVLKENRKALRKNLTR